MKVEIHRTKWGSAIRFGPFIDWQDKNIWHREYTLGFSFGKWDFEVKIILWDIEESIEMLKSRGMTEQEAWDFCDRIRQTLPDPYDSRVNMRKKIERAIA